jgi:HAMP domain-containing protein
MIYAIGSMLLCLLLAIGAIAILFLMEWLERDLRR